MKDVKYIVDSDDKKESVILDNQKFGRIQKLLKQQLVLSILDMVVKDFDISAIVKEKGKEKKVYASLILISLAKLFYYADKYKIDVNNHEIIITDEQIGDFFGFHEKNIQTQRNKVIKPYMDSENGKAVINYVQHPINDQDGAKYTLNYLASIEKAVDDYLRENNFGIDETIEIIHSAKRFQNIEKEDFNNTFKTLLKTVNKNLKDLPKDPIFEERNNAKGSRKSLKSKSQKKIIS